MFEFTDLVLDFYELVKRSAETVVKELEDNNLGCKRIFIGGGGRQETYFLFFEHSLESAAVFEVEQF